MAGKGQRRRQKNFLASHGGDRRLPPPPNPRDVDALPSKLRRLLELQNNATPGAPERDWRKGGSGADPKKPNKRNADTVDESKKKEQNSHDSKDEASPKKKKRKRKAFVDPHVQNLLLGGEHSTRRQRKKEYLNARKNKHKKIKEDNVREFPGREDVRFGEVVDAPPKLSIPKALKIPKDASKERLRLQAVEAYRNRKKWVSRPGINLPSITETSTS